jgi:hypothetical protein
MIAVSCAMLSVIAVSGSVVVADSGDFAVEDRILSDSGPRTQEERTGSGKYAFCVEYRLDNSLERRLRTPEGYSRITLADSQEYGRWLRGIPLKPQDTPVLAFDGRLVKPADRISGIVDLNVASPYCQCADMAIRLRAEFFWSSGRIGKIAFRSLSGQRISMQDWLQGSYHVSTGGDRIDFYPGEVRPASRREFEDYLEFVWRFANSRSLARDLTKVPEEDLAPGDMYIQPAPYGGLGHLSLILDIAEDGRGGRIFLWAYGFVPAQNLHLPLPGEGNGVGEWYTLEGFLREVQGFGPGDFHRFPDRSEIRE